MMDKRTDTSTLHQDGRTRHHSSFATNQSPSPIRPRARSFDAAAVAGSSSSSAARLFASATISPPGVQSRSPTASEFHPNYRQQQVTADGSTNTFNASASGAVPTDRPSLLSRVWAAGDDLSALNTIPPLSPLTAPALSATTHTLDMTVDNTTTMSAHQKLGETWRDNNIYANISSRGGRQSRSSPTRQHTATTSAGLERWRRELSFARLASPAVHSRSSVTHVAFSGASGDGYMNKSRSNSHSNRAS
jgi:hypothetical protein